MTTTNSRCYGVWVEGEEVNKHLLTFEEARVLAREYILKDKEDDVVVIDSYDYDELVEKINKDYDDCIVRIPAMPNKKEGL